MLLSSKPRRRASLRGSATTTMLITTGTALALGQTEYAAFPKLLRPDQRHDIAAQRFEGGHVGEMAERTNKQDVEGRARLFSRRKPADVHAVRDVESAAGVAPTGLDGLSAIRLAYGP